MDQTQHWHLSSHHPAVIVTSNTISDYHTPNSGFKTASRTGTAVGTRTGPSTFFGIHVVFTSLIVSIPTAIFFSIARVDFAHLNRGIPVNAPWGTALPGRQPFSPLLPLRHTCQAYNTGARILLSESRHSISEIRVLVLTGVEEVRNAGISLFVTDKSIGNRD